MSTLIPIYRNSLAPWPAFRELEDRLARIFSGMPLDAEVAGGTWAPAVDLRETNDAYIIEADLPGMNKEDISLSVVEGVVTLKGKRETSKETKDEGCHRIERSYGEFQRSFRFPGGVDASKVEATYENGVLKVTLPKPEQARPRQIDVKVK